MPRPRTTKGIAKRIELTYYQRVHPFRRWWRMLCLVVPAVGVLWLVVMAILGDQRLYTSGPVVTAHQMFDAACERCHIDVPRPPAVAADGPGAPQAAKTVPGVHRGGWFLRRVSDGACLTCHDGSIHHQAQTFEPPCVGCHIEHQGRTTLGRISDRHCTQCHASLTVKGGAPPQFERQIASLANHVEFAVVRKGLKDDAQIKLSHATHLKPDLPAGGGKRVTLGCPACHGEDVAGRYMLPVTYRAHCAECHPLEAGPDLVAPHDRPEIVRGFLLANLTARRGGAVAPAAAPAAAPEETEKSGGGRRRGGSPGAMLEGLLERVGFRWGGRAEPVVGPPGLVIGQRQRAGSPESPPPAPAPPAEESQPAGRRRGAADAPRPPAERAPAAGAPGGLAAVTQAEKELFTGRTGCKFCHTVEEGEAGLPAIAPTKIPARWFPHSRFEHRVHRPLTCVACHGGAPKSVETTDVLMPTIQVCRDCHRDGGARAGCVECHRYHDRATERPANGPLTVPEFVSGRSRAGVPAATKTP
ncbi:MAG: cytochrome c3 family protein [Candidatus Rokuibacteriota bacterium]